jgi:hypothetical protein
VLTVVYVLGAVGSFVAAKVPVDVVVLNGTGSVGFSDVSMA